MIAKRTDLAGTNDRPFNNLLRRLNAADYELIAPHLAVVDAAAGELLYNPGDDVQIVHFPCGPSLASYMVANEDGRDVETILVGREGAVGGIVSQGFLPAFTRIAVKFGGPFARLPISKLDAAKLKSISVRATSSRAMPTACWRRSSSRPPATRSTRSSSAPRNGSSRRWSAPMATGWCR
ncbi:hypothetical protein ACVILK_004837 [Bradyrhizobium embrapense]